MMKTLKKIAENSNRNLKQNGKTETGNVEIPYNKGAKQEHAHLTLAINHA